MDRITKVCDEKKCVGCSLCQSICPMKAISINKESGFYRPVISDKCIGCKKCVNFCPGNSLESIDDAKNKTPDFAYAAWNKNQNIHKYSTSGGIAYTIAKKIISDGGFAVGIWFNPKTGQVEHRIYEKIDDLYLMQGSKYVQSDKTGIYAKVVEYLKEKQGIFIGVPCEVFAMKQYLKSFKKLELNKLYFIDLLCHGGASPLCLSQHIKKLSKSKIDNISFRGGNYDCKFSLYKKNKLVYQDTQFQDPYFFAFMKHSIYQPACFDCQYSGSERIGDITLGDFWGLDKKIEEQSPVQGINMVFANNEDGKLLLSIVKDELVLIKRNIYEAINGNDTLKCPTIMEKEYDNLWEEIRNAGFHKAVNKVYKLNWKKRYIKSKMKLMYKKITGEIKKYEKI